MAVHTRDHSREGEVFPLCFAQTQPWVEGMSCSTGLIAKPIIDYPRVQTVWDSAKGEVYYQWRPNGDLYRLVQLVWSTYYVLRAILQRGSLLTCFFPLLDLTSGPILASE